MSVNYTLKNPNGVIGRLSFFKPSFKVGEDVTGALDLSLATTTGLQVSQGSFIHCWSAYVHTKNHLQISQTQALFNSESFFVALVFID